MHKKEIKQTRRDWVLIVAGSILGFIVSVAANAFYDLLTQPALRHLYHFLIFAFVSWFFAAFFYFLFEKHSEMNKGGMYLFKEFLKSEFKKSNSID